MVKPLIALVVSGAGGRLTLCLDRVVQICVVMVGSWLLGDKQYSSSSNSQTNHLTVARGREINKIRTRQKVTRETCKNTHIRVAPGEQWRTSYRTQIPWQTLQNGHKSSASKKEIEKEEKAHLSLLVEELWEHRLQARGWQERLETPLHNWKHVYSLALQNFFPLSIWDDWCAGERAARKQVKTTGQPFSQKF